MPGKLGRRLAAAGYERSDLEAGIARIGERMAPAHVAETGDDDAKGGR